MGETELYIYVILFLVAFLAGFVDSIAAVFYEMIIFIGILLFGLLYAWKRGALQWN